MDAGPGKSLVTGPTLTRMLACPVTTQQDRQEPMVTVARFESPVEAQIAKGLLQSAGIESDLTGEYANQLIQSAFETQLQVRAHDEAEARELLAQAGEKTGAPEFDAGEGLG